MQQFHHFLVLVLPLIFLPLTTSAARPNHEVSIAGGWTPIKDIKDPHVIEIAKFAVDEYNKIGNTIPLKFVTVVSGETQVVSGMNYRLVLKAADETVTKTYQAIVWENLFKNKKLISSEPFQG